MKKIISIVGLCVVSLMGAYTGFWFYAADSFKQAVIAKSQGCLIYEGIKCRGFPFKIETRIDKPLLQGEYGEVYTQGYWAIGANLLGTKSWFEIAGETTLDVGDLSNLNAELTYKISGMVRLAFTQPIKSLNIFKNLENLFPNHSKFGFWNDTLLSAKDLTIAYGSDNQPVFEVKNLTCVWDKIEASPAYAFGRFINLDLQGFDIHWENMRQHTPPHMFDNPFHIWVSEQQMNSGKGDLSIQARILASASLVGTIVDGKQDFAVCLDIEKFVHTDLLSSGKMKGRFELNKNLTKHSGSIFLDSMTEYAKQTDRPFPSLLSILIQNSQETDKLRAENPLIDNLLANHWDKIEQLMPDYSSLSPFETHLNLDYAIDTDEVSPNQSWDLKECTLKMKDNEIALRGRLDIPVTNKISFLEVKLTNYEQALQKLADYCNEWQSLFTSTQTVSTKEMPPVNHKVVARISGFLKALSNYDQADRLCIVIERNTEVDWTIGPFNTQQFDLAWQQLIRDITSDIRIPCRMPADSVLRPPKTANKRTTSHKNLKPPALRVS